MEREKYVENVEREQIKKIRGREEGKRVQNNNLAFVFKTQLCGKKRESFGLTAKQEFSQAVYTF